jgi:carbohydrate kinase (thermoresistant glucokinase family)
MMIVVLAGVAGSGKTAVGRALADQLGWAFEDADALHSPADIAKMHSGVPLTDADRWPWLEAVAAWLDARIAAGTPAVVACSVLKRSYRDLLYRGRPAVQIVMLQADAATLTARLIARRGHFFPAKLLQSQLSDLEMPDHDERTLVVPTVHPPAEIADEIIRRLGLTPAPPRGLPWGLARDERRRDEAQAGPARHLQPGP